MKFLAVSFLSLLFPAAALYAQQPVDPSADTHVKDNASLGNHRPSKPEKNPTTRTVSGQVTDGTGQLLQGAMVTLTNKRTNEKTNFFTKKDGRYEFGELSFLQDYEVQARYKDKESVSRRLSQFDKTAKPVRILEIETAPMAKNSAANANAQPK